jgi:hypothetical protein
MKTFKFDCDGVARKTIARATMLLMMFSATACVVDGGGDSAHLEDSESAEDLDEPEIEALSSTLYKGLEFVSYKDLKDGTSSFTNVTSKYILVDHSAGKQGWNDIVPGHPGLVKVTGAKLVKVGGGRDKYLALFEVTNKAKVDIVKKSGAAHALFVKTTKVLAVLDVKSIDPEIGKQKVPGANQANNEVVFYAEDEGNKDSNRDTFYESRAFEQWGDGDDRLYVFTDNTPSVPGVPGVPGYHPNGNGAYMKVKIK